MGNNVIRLDDTKVIRPFNRYGGKANFVRDFEPFILKMALENNCDTFVDCFAGAGTVGLYALNMINPYTLKPLFKKVWLNDIDISVTRVFNLLKQEPENSKQLSNMLYKTAYCKESFDYAHQTLDEIRNGEREDKDLEIAYLSIVESRLSYNSACQSYRDFRNCKSKKKPVDYEELFHRKALELPELASRLDRLEVHEGSYLDLLIENQEKHFFQIDRSIIFCDPPYFQPERSAQEVYKDEMGTVDHVILIQTLVCACRHWLLCGYQNNQDIGYLKNVYKILDRNPNVRKYDLGLKNRPSSGNKAKAGDPHEILWVKA